MGTIAMSIFLISVCVIGVIYTYFDTRKHKHEDAE